ncbi:MAG: hypothetical protein NC347_05510 [Clostridium sp.]|nr:hypothetical protein [Clostridium sp.]
MPEIDFLPRQTSWSNSIIQYGNLEGDCIEFLLSDKRQVEEIECRLDIRCITKEKLERVLRYINQIEADIYMDGKIISPQMEKIISLIRDSPAMKFCIDPQAFLEALGMMENDLVELSRVDDNIVITKVKKDKDITLEDIFRNYDGEYVTEEFDWGSPVGKEVW